MTKRLIELAPTSLFGEKAIVTSFSGREELSKPFDFQFTVFSPDLNVRPEQVIGLPMSVRVNRENGETRFFHGYAANFWAGNVVRQRNELPVRHYQVRMVPWLWFMSRAARCFVYLPEKREKAIHEVLDELIKRVKSYTHILPSIESTNAKILQTRKVEHCVQYRETDLNFLSRTLEQYGVFYHFKHAEDKHTLVLSDQLNYPNAPESAVKYGISMHSGQPQGTIDNWEHAYEFVSGEFEHKDYDPINPSTNLTANARKHSSIPLKNNSSYELYDYPGEYVQKDDGEVEAAFRMEAEETRFDEVRGSSDCRTFSAGYCFKLTEHPTCDDEKGKSYLITSVSHSARQPGHSSTSGEVASYKNSFTCIPRDRQYRPKRITPQPILSSIQTAVVVGPKGEEIHTDKYGRIKVRFHWDREPDAGENHSCWIRCQQSIAGNQWGFMAIPRIGQEVIVQFLEGDLDSPLVTGCVYNAEQMPHYELPAEKTKTYIKTNSSLGGKGHNELMFEDKAKDERVYIHAQKNMDVRVLNDSKARTFGNRHQIIGWEKDGKKGGDQREMVYEDKHLNVKQHQYEHIEGNMQLLIGEGEAKEGGNLDIVVEKQKSELIGGDSHLIVKGSHSEQVDGGCSLTLGGDSHTKVGGNIAQEAGSKGEIHLKAGMKVIIEAGVQISLKGPGGFIDIGPAGVTIQGTMVLINSGGAAGSGGGCKPKAPKEAKKAKPAKPEVAHNSTSGAKSTKG